MANIGNRDELRTAYDDVRDDNSETNWITLEYDDGCNSIVAGNTGTDYEEFQGQFADDKRMYGYVRVQTGDELSKRNKFALIVWIGSEVSTLKKAYVSTDQVAVREIFENFATLLQVTELEDLAFDQLKEKLVKAGGAAYGTGVRE